MCRRSTIFKGLFVVVLVASLTGCVTTAPKPTEGNFVMPTVTLTSVELPYYTGYWYFSNKVKPTKGQAGNYGAPLGHAFIFEVMNPNGYPVMLEGLKFTVSFEDFDLNTVTLPEGQWIPAGKTNQIRVNGIIDTRSALLSLLVTGGFKLKEKGMSPWAALEKIWTSASEYSLPIEVKEGSAIFKADTMTKVATFGGTFP